MHNEAQQLAESLNSIWPDAQAFTAALLAAVNQVQTLARVPHEEFAIEMAIAILFLEKSLEDLQDSNIHFSNRAATLAKRMEAIQQGQQPPARDAWMDEFYIKLNSKDSTEQVITESRAALAEVEQALDSFFRHPQNTESAQRASGKLVEISSILMILGCKHKNLYRIFYFPYFLNLASYSSISSNVRVSIYRSHSLFWSVKMLTYWMYFKIGVLQWLSGWPCCAKSWNSMNSWVDKI